MPILKNRPPKYQRSGKYAVVYHDGKRIYLGLYGSQESQVAYSRFVAESQADPTFHLSKAETSITGQVHGFVGHLLAVIRGTVDDKL